MSRSAVDTIGWTSPCYASKQAFPRTESRPPCARGCPEHGEVTGGRGGSRLGENGAWEVRMPRFGALIDVAGINDFGPIPATSDMVPNWYHAIPRGPLSLPPPPQRSLESLGRE